MGALGLAFLDQLAQPERRICFRVKTLETPGVTTMSARDYAFIDPGEEALLNSLVDPFFARACEEKRPLRVLDIGCGLGRHLAWCLDYPGRRNCPVRVEVVGIEHDTHLVPFCRDRFGPQAIRTSADDLFEEPLFDLVLLLGGNLGIFGRPERTREGVAGLRQLLRPGGALLCDSASSEASDYVCLVVEISYGGITDQPMPWGFATPAWTRSCLRECGFPEVLHHRNPERPELTLTVGYAHP